MTVSSEIMKSRFSCDGTSKNFSIPWKVQREDGVALYMVNTSVVPHTYSQITSNYAISPAQGSYPSLGATVVYPVNGQPISNDYEFLVSRMTPLLQNSTFRFGGTYDPEYMERVLDNLVMEIQQVNEVASRSVRLPVAADTSKINTVLPYPVADKILAWNEDGSALINVDLQENTVATINAAERAEAASTSALASSSAATTAAESAAEAALDAASSAARRQLVMYPYTEVATFNNQKVFPIPMDTFDTLSDGVMVYQNTTFVNPNNYVVTNATYGDDNLILERGYITLSDGVVSGTEIDIIVFKNAPANGDLTVLNSAYAARDAAASSAQSSADSATRALQSGITNIIDNLDGTLTITYGLAGTTMTTVDLKGATGATGAAATISVGTVTTLSPGSQATVSNSGTSSAATFNFGIPKGADGTGSGDMLKSVYDTANRGYVDRAFLADTIANNSATDLAIGNRTITDGTLLSSYTGDLTTLLTGIAALLKAITGKSNAYTAPATTLEQLWGLVWTEKFILSQPSAGFVSPALPLTRNGSCSSIKFYPQGSPSAATGVYVFKGQSITLSADITNSATTATTNTTMTGTVPFYASIGSEVVQVTAINGTTITITRGQLSTTAAAHTSGAVVAPTIGNVSLSASTPTTLTLSALAGTAEDQFFYAVSGSGLSAINVTIMQKWVNA